jgi:hypothetical protein
MMALAKNFNGESNPFQGNNPIVACARSENHAGRSEAGRFRLQWNVLRVAAIVLVAVFSSLLIAPGAYVSAASRLPACCRTHGEHKCVMETGGAGIGHAGLTISASCPFASHGQTSGTPGIRLSAPGTSEAIFAGLVSHPAIQRQTEARFRISALRSCQKRGPPTQLS